MSGKVRAHSMLTDEPVLTPNARKVLEARYLAKNERGECTETPVDLFRRVAHTIANVELAYGASEMERRDWEARFYSLMATGQFMPNSPTLMNAGREMGMLSACFVLPVRDSIVDIFNSIKHTALIQKAGGGTGFAFDELRPTGDFIQSSGGTTSGPISFWRAFSEATNAIQQGAFRRGANMGMMYIHHPDILKFLHAKQDLNQFTNYNISVKVTDVWMHEFLEDPDSPHIVRNPRTGASFALPRDLDIRTYEIRNLPEVHCVRPVSRSAPERYYRTPEVIGPLPEELRGKVYTKADIWNIIVRNAWQTGEPGVVFIDRINEHNPTPHVGRIEATNPCGEQPLLPYEACNLGSINLGLFIRNACTPQADVDWEALRIAIQESTRFLDNVIDANNYPLPEIDRICHDNRKIGLGVMGFADALYKLNVPYDSDEGVAWGERFMQFLDDEAHNYSEALARERGCFPNWQGSIWQTRHNRMMRNAATTTVAPTGTISIIANCSGGIEPMFSLAFIRNVLKGQKQGERPLVEVNEVFRQVAIDRGFYSDDLIEQAAREGTIAHNEAIPVDVRRVFVCAHDIAPEWHMRMQAAFQRHCDSSISKTINFPQGATPADVEKIYTLAFEMGCKGVTVYRDGCRECQPMALKKDAAGENGAAAANQLGPEACCNEPATKLTTPVSDLDRTAPAGEKSLEERRKGDAGGSPAPGPQGWLTSARSARATPLSSEEGSEEGQIGATPVRVPSPSRLTAPSRQRAVAPPPSAAAVVREDARPAAPVAASCAVPLVPPPIEPLDLPEIVSGLRIRQLTPFGNMHVKITVDPRADRELEVFAQLGKGGDVANSDLEAICRMVSLWLRAGGTLQRVVKQLEGIGSSLQIPTRAGRIMSLGDGLACALKKYTRAKERFGLRNLLLGEIDLTQLDRPTPPHEPPHVFVDHSLGIAKSEEQIANEGCDVCAATEPPEALARGTRSSEFPGASSEWQNRRDGGPPADSATGSISASPVRPPRSDRAVPSEPRAEASDPRPLPTPRPRSSDPARGGNGHPQEPSVPRLHTTIAPAPAVGPVPPSAKLGPIAFTPGAQPAPGLDSYVTMALAIEAGAFGAEPAALATTTVATEVLNDPSTELFEAQNTEVLEAHSAEVFEAPPAEVLEDDPVTRRAHAAFDLSAVLGSVHHEHDAAVFYGVKCPECGQTLVLQEGCRKCHGCGWAAC